MLFQNIFDYFKRFAQNIFMYAYAYKKYFCASVSTFRLSTDLKIVFSNLSVFFYFFYIYETFKRLGYNGILCSNPKRMKEVFQIHIFYIER